ncbi:DUF3408 domain-containing protein [Bacteroides neonati]|uniref:DUF3408 domain-containing protein n=1 Tax=Bacteroides neonati TaxID=1347393 RepID=UPI0004AD9CDF
MESKKVDALKMQKMIAKGFQLDDDEPIPEESIPLPQERPQEVDHKKEPPITVERAKRKTVSKGDYETLFIFKNDLKERKTIYVAKEVQEKLAEIVMSMKKQEITIGIYVENIILHHFEMYKDEINTLYESKIQKPL